MQPDETEQDVVPITPVDSQTNEVETPVSEPTSQSNGSTPANMPPMAPESPINASNNTPVEDQNPPINQPESNAQEEPISAPNNEPQTPVDDQPSPVQSAPVPAPTPQAQIIPQMQPSALENQTSFIRALLAKANAKLGSNRQKKLDKLMLTTQKKGFITNEQAQELLHCSDATATRYLSKLVQQGRLNRTDGSHWVKYIFVR